jgi:Ca-activated chloride channel family protein
METEYCTRCQLKSEGEFLREIAHSGERSLHEILRQARQKEDSCIGRKASKYVEQRRKADRQRLQEYEWELKELEENASYEAMDDLLQGKGIDEIERGMLGDQARKGLEEKIGSLRWKPEDTSEQDVRQALEEYEREGYIDIQAGKVNITSTGARSLASNALQRILQTISRKELGSHSVEETGFGSELAAHTRDYEAGDDYSLVNIERTALNALERHGRLELELGDFAVHEEVHQSRLCAGLLIDKSGSMRSGHKLEAAMETALALSELIRREPKDSLKVFLFSVRVKHIPPWGIVNEMLSGGFTDIRSAMRDFLKAVRTEKGDRQAYLITDTEPNAEEGKYVGFERAVAGVMDEALLYRQHNVGLNIIMLDETPHLRQVASAMARKNLGRVFFTTPHRLGQLVVDDYLRAKRGWL